MAQLKSLGVVEYRSVALGISAVDHMIKAAGIEIITMQTVCPGKYIILFEGSLSAVNTALEVAEQSPFDEVLVDTYMLGNPDQSLFPAIHGLVEKKDLAAIGIIEGCTVASIVGVADQLVKTSPVTLIEVRLARGMSGRSYAIFSGEIAAVNAALEKGKALLIENGSYLHSASIAAPDEAIWEAL